jgi:hypothetical protein
MACMTLSPGGKEGEDSGAPGVVLMFGVVMGTRVSLSSQEKGPDDFFTLKSGPTRVKPRFPIADFRLRIGRVSFLANLHPKSAIGNRAVAGGSGKW